MTDAGTTPGYTLGHIDPLRAEFAKAALQGLLANQSWVNGKTLAALDECKNNIETATIWLKRELAEDAVEIADAVIEQLGINAVNKAKEL